MAGEGDVPGGVPLMQGRQRPQLMLHFWPRVAPSVSMALPTSSYRLLRSAPPRGRLPVEQAAAEKGKRKGREGKGCEDGDAWAVQPSTEQLKTESHCKIHSS